MKRRSMPLTTNSKPSEAGLSWRGGATERIELSAKPEAEGAQFAPTRRGQANKSARGMPWHQEPKKDVTSCDKPRGAANTHYIRGFPNGETPLPARVTTVR